MTRPNTADGRRRQWVPLSSTFAHGKTGTKLLEKFGPDGLLVWVCLLAAAKRATIQGTFMYVSEEDAWQQLGLLGYQPEFTFEAFLRVTGHLKQTRTTHLGHAVKTPKTRRGRTVKTEITRWEDWGKDIKRDLDAEGKRRKAAEDAANLEREKNEDASYLHTSDLDPDYDSDFPPAPQRGANGSITLSRKQLRQYTGCRYSRGSHSASYVQDVLGKSKPPSDWPHPPPEESEIIEALATQGDGR